MRSRRASHAKSVYTSPPRGAYTSFTFVNVVFTNVNALGIKGMIDADANLGRNCVYKR
jgi:hypothetical protein